MMFSLTTEQNKCIADKNRIITLQIHFWADRQNRRNSVFATIIAH